MLETVEEKTGFGKREVLDPDAIRASLDGFSYSYQVFPLFTTALAERHLGSWFAEFMEIVNSASEIRIGFEIWLKKDLFGEKWFVCNFRFGPNRFLVYVEEHPEELRWRIEEDENRVIPRFSSLPELRMKLGISGGGAGL